jgi:Carboxylesterase family
MIWLPVIEAQDFGEERFFTEHPLESYKNAEKLSKVPLMIGVTELEMVYAVPCKKNITIGSFIRKKNVPCN